LDARKGVINALLMRAVESNPQFRILFMIARFLEGIIPKAVDLPVEMDGTIIE
jgi:hypothetical protein